MTELFLQPYADILPRQIIFHWLQGPRPLHSGSQLTFTRRKSDPTHRVGSIVIREIRAIREKPLQSSGDKFDDAMGG